MCEYKPGTEKCEYTVVRFFFFTLYGKKGYHLIIDCDKLKIWTVNPKVTTKSYNH